MKHIQHSSAGGQVTSLAFSYERLEIGEFDRITDEARAIESIFGQTSQSHNPEQPLVIVGYDRQKVKQLLLTQRDSPESCLRPIVVVGLGEHSLDAEIMQLADWILPPQADSVDLHETRTGVELLMQQLSAMPRAMDDRALNLLQFLQSRAQSLQPVVDPDAAFAYRYPLAERLLAKSSQELNELLEDMATHDVLNRKHIDRVFTCPDCNHYRTCVKELCPQCSSTHLNCQESIHHFRCGYVAPEAEFMVKGRPQCPKCHGDIQHIGVEYNRPGQFVVCGDCHYWASEPNLQAWCAVCNRYHDPADLKPVNVYAYRLHSNAMRIARHGSWQPGATSPSGNQESLTSSGALSLTADPDERPTADTQGKSPKQSKGGVVKAISQLIQKLAQEQDEATLLYRVEFTSEAVDLQAVKRMLQAFARDAMLCVDINEDEKSLSLVLKADDPNCPSTAELEQSLSTAMDADCSVLIESDPSGQHNMRASDQGGTPALSAG